MNWILLILFIYTLTGSVLASRNMRGLHVQANLSEWVVLILLWPLSLKIYAQLAMVQSMIRDLEHWSDNQDQETG
jgi:hypothetical protein